MYMQAEANDKTKPWGNDNFPQGLILEFCAWEIIFLNTIEIVFSLTDQDM